MSPSPLHRRIGQLAIVGFDGQTPPADLRALARAFDLGGVILFARNVEAPEQVAELVHDLQGLAGELPLWISIDQEGGRVARLRHPFTEWPPMATLGRSGDEGLAERFARALARELKAVGISLDYAPVMDVHTNPKNPVIGNRAISGEAGEVARLGTVIIRTLQANGIAACAKHFPGHGDTSQDSHHELPVVEHPPDRLRAIELLPFRAAIDAGVASIMMAHVLVPALDDEAPASLSPAIIERLLRRDLGYQGLVLSDDLGMRAVSARYTLSEAAVRAIAAGSDAVLLCGTDHAEQFAALESLIRAVESEEIPYRRMDEALARQRRMKERFMAAPVVASADSADAAAIADAAPLSRTWRPPAPAVLRTTVGCDEHRAVAEEMGKYL